MVCDPSHKGVVDTPVIDQAPTAPSATNTGGPSADDLAIERAAPSLEHDEAREGDVIVYRGGRLTHRRRSTTP